MVTREQAENAYEFHYGECKILRGPKGGLRRMVQERWRRNGRMKIWVRNPERWEIPIKNGLRNYSYLNNKNAHLFHTVDECPLNQEV